MKPFVIAFGVAGSLLITACDTGGTSKVGADRVMKSGTAAGPCAYLSKDEVSAIIGSAVTRVMVSEDSCFYYTASDLATEVMVQANGGAERMELVRKAMQQHRRSGGRNVEGEEWGADDVHLPRSHGDVHGRGGEALWGPNLTLSVLHGNAYVEVVPPILYDPVKPGGNPMIEKDQRREMALRLASAMVAKID